MRQNLSNIRIGSLNCQGLKSKYEIPEFISDVTSHELFGVNEIWLENSDVENIVVPGYKFYAKCRSKEKGPVKGGVGVFVKEELRPGIKIMSAMSNEYCLWCKLDKKIYNYGEDVYIGFVYIPPMESSREKKKNDDHFRMLNDKIAKIPSEHVILIGDFNARTREYTDTLSDIDDKLEDLEMPGLQAPKNIPQRNNQDKKANKYGRKLVDLCLATNSYILNGRTLGDVQGKLTCYQPQGTSTVDYAIVNETLLQQIVTFRVSTPTISDHTTISLQMKITILRIEKEENLIDPDPQIRWNDKTKELFHKSIQSMETKNAIQEINDLLESDNKSCIDEAVKKMNDIYSLKGPRRKEIRKRSHKKESKKWYDYSCYEMSKKLNQIGKLVEKNPKDPFLRGQLMTRRKEYRKLIKLKKLQWKDNMIRKLEEIEEKSPAEYWKIVKDLKEKKKAGKMIEKPEEFEQFFKKLFSIENPNIRTQKQKEIEALVNETLKKSSSTPTENYSMEELKSGIKKLKANRSSLLVPAEMLKESPDFILLTLLKIANKVKNSCYFPHEWAKGITTLLHKDGEEDDPSNYRAITVADAIAKVMTIMMNERLSKKIEEEKIIPYQQIAFKKKSRPADHLFVLKNVFEKYLSSGKKVYTCFVDFQKAYDSVWRVGLYYKLIKCGIDINVIKLIKDMYDKTSQIIKMNGKVTKPLQTYKGVRQGCILSPRLFNIFLRDLPDIFDQKCNPVKIGNTDVSCLMFADDIVLLSESQEGLHNCLKRLEEYTSQWDMTVNKKKTKIMIIQNTGRKTIANYTYDGQTLEVVEKYKYLGTIVSKTGNFKLNHAYLRSKGLKARYAITRNIGLDCKASTLMKLFQKMVEPILLYNCEIAQASIPNSWDEEKFKLKMWEDKEIDKVTKGYMRQILGVHKKTTIMGLRAELGKYPLSLNIYIQIIKYWTRLLSTENILLQEAHIDNLERMRRNKPCWIKTVMFILKTCGLQQIDIKEISEKETTFHRETRKKLTEAYHENWKMEAEKMSDGKMAFYTKIKKNFHFETYLDKIPRMERKSITKLRLSCHSLPIEKMRYQKIQRVERKCTICKENEIGDEWHYLTRCKQEDLNTTRKEFIQLVKNIQPQLENFSTEDLMIYAISMNDTLIQVPAATFAKNLLQIYSDVTEKEEGSCSIM